MNSSRCMKIMNCCISNHRVDLHLNIDLTINSRDIYGLINMNVLHGENALMKQCLEHISLHN